jgi:hypothetical protein
MRIRDATDRAETLRRKSQSLLEASSKLIANSQALFRRVMGHDDNLKT